MTGAHAEEPGTLPTAGEDFDVNGVEVDMAAEEYFHDIAKALFLAVNNMRIKAWEAESSYPADFTDVTMPNLQNYFIEHLDPWDITRIYNMGWGPDPSGGADPDGCFPPDPGPHIQRQWKVTDPNLTARAARMEKALNDVLQSLWGGEETDYDAHNGAAGTTGVYSYDWDGSEAVPAAGTFVDTAAPWEEWSPIHAGTEYQTYPATAASTYFHGPEEILDDTLGGYASAGKDPYTSGEHTDPALYGESHLSATGEWFIGPSRFWHVVVRAELVNTVDPNAPVVIARSDLEFVYVNDPDADGDPSDGHVLYQRWIQRGD
jgi:hypothetical protein